jgi:ABC-type multidrug transport system ATPase subunit
MQPAIVFGGLFKSFGAHAVLDGVTAEVPAGAVYGFLGNNGAGKTTTIRICLGLLRPDGGTVRVLGEDPLQARQVLQKVGSLIEPALYDRLTGRENLEVARLRMGLAHTEVDRILGLVGMTKDQHRLVGTCSSGMRQRLALGRALLGHPELLILDEPMTALDPQGVEELRDLIRSLPSQTGSTVFLSSHDLGEVELMSTHLGILHRGRLIASGSIASVISIGRREIELGVLETDAAMAHLAREGRRVRRVDERRVAIDVSAQDDFDAEAAAINKRLVEAGFQVHAISTSPSSLTEVFKSFTAGASE